MAGNQVSRLFDAGKLEQLPKSRAEALTKGIRHYFSGNPCPKGHVDARSADSGKCMECGRISAREYSKKNRKVAAERDRKRRAENPDKFRERKRKWTANNIEKVRQAKRESYYRNRDSIREKRAIKYIETKEIAKNRSKEWREENRDRHRDYSRRWAKDNPQKRRVQNQNRRAISKSASGSHTVDDVIRIRKMQKDKCGYCGIKLKGGGHLDHIIALSKGGSNAPSNLQWLCEPCNVSKKARDPIEFAQSLGRLL